ncbi:hypothetical protein ScPMuIL_009805 [Solemya velum]
MVVNDLVLENNSYHSISQTESHCHDGKKKSGLDKVSRKKIVLASILCVAFMTGEIIGGIIAHSLAIVSDAAHLLTDFASFMISLLAIFLTTRGATKKLSFGWYRAEILGALVSILMLWVITGVLAYMAVLRIVDDDYEINATVMLITAGCGVAFNLLMGATLHQYTHTHSHGHSHHDTSYEASNSYGSVNTLPNNSIDSSHELNDDSENEPLVHQPKKHGSNINVKAAFIHVIGDLIQSIGVCVAAFIIYFKPEWKIVDPICTFIFSIVVLVTTITILRDILVVLMEGTPKGIDFMAVQNSFFDIPGIRDLHDLRLWSLSMEKIAMSIHIAVDKGSDPLLVLKRASSMVKQRFGIHETTIQVEEYVEEMLDCSHCQDLPD